MSTTSPAPDPPTPTTQPGRVGRDDTDLIWVRLAWMLPLVLAPAGLALMLVLPTKSVGNLMLTGYLLVAALVTGVLHRRGAGGNGGSYVPKMMSLGALGMVIETFASIGVAQRPRPAPADVYFALMVPVIIVVSARLWRRQLWPGHHTVLLRGLLDSFQVLVALIIVYWHLVVVPSLNAGVPMRVAAWGVPSVVAAGVVVAPLVVRALRRTDLASGLLAAGGVLCLAGAWVWSVAWDPLSGATEAEAILSSWLMGVGVLLTMPAYALNEADRAAPRPSRWLIADVLPLSTQYVAWTIVVAMATGGPMRQSSLVLGVISMGLVLARIVTVRSSERQLLITMERMAFTDPLTGLGNRRFLTDTLGTRDGWLLTLDLDGFKEINDRYGHGAGDQALRDFAVRIRQTVPATTSPVRLGGDEFAVVVDGTDDEVVTLGNLLVEQARDPRFNGLSVSIGATRFTAGADPEQVMRDSDIALQHAKRSGKNRLAVLDEHLLAERLRELDLAEALRADDPQISLVYQPIVGIAGPVQGLVAVEALARWRHPTMGAIGPSEFIPIAERHGLIGDLGRHILGVALRQAQDWKDAGRPTQICVNISGYQLRDPRSVRELQATLAAHPTIAPWLVLEVTESVFADDEDAVAALRCLRGSGARVAIDDFGIGSSTLTRLRRLPIDVLKADGELTRDLGAATSDAILDLVVQLGRRLGIDVVVEAVENDGELNELLAIGCRYGQGHHLGAPTPADQVPVPVSGHPVLGAQSGDRAARTSKAR